MKYLRESLFDADSDDDLYRLSIRDDFRDIIRDYLKTWNKRDIEAYISRKFGKNMENVSLDSIKLDMNRKDVNIGGLFGLSYVESVYFKMFEMLKEILDEKHNGARPDIILNIGNSLTSFTFCMMLSPNALISDWNVRTGGYGSQSGLLISSNFCPKVNNCTFYNPYGFQLITPEIVPATIYDGCTFNADPKIGFMYIQGSDYESLKNCHINCPDIILNVHYAKQLNQLVKAGFLEKSTHGHEKYNFTKSLMYDEIDPDTKKIIKKFDPVKFLPKSNDYSKINRIFLVDTSSKLGGRVLIFSRSPIQSEPIGGFNISDVDLENGWIFYGCGYGGSMPMSSKIKNLLHNTSAKLVAPILKY